MDVNFIPLQVWRVYFEIRGDFNIDDSLAIEAAVEKTLSYKHYVGFGREGITVIAEDADIDALDNVLLQLRKRGHSVIDAHSPQEIANANSTGYFIYVA